MPLLARRINWSLRPLGHRVMLRSEDLFEVLNYSKNRSIFGWSSRPRMALNGQNSGSGLCLGPQCIPWKQWGTDLWRSLGVMALKKNFHQTKAELTSPTSKENWIFQWFCKKILYFNTAFWAPKQCSTSGYRPNRWIYHKKFDRFCTFSAHFWSWCTRPLGPILGLPEPARYSKVNIFNYPPARYPEVNTRKPAGIFRVLKWAQPITKMRRKSPPRVKKCGESLILMKRSELSNLLGVLA